MTQFLIKQKIAKYFPLANGQYEITPGLFSLKHDFGNKEHDNRLFQFDLDFLKYRQNKLNAHNEQLSKYYCINGFTDLQQQYLTQFIITTLCREYPNYFSLLIKNKSLAFTCKLTNEEIILSKNFALLNSNATHYSNLLDAVMMQVQEDLAVITEDDHIACLHLMAPNFWSASSKIGKSFNEIHHPVAGIESITKNSKAIVNAMIHKGPYVRFAWGISTDEELNHHPNQIQSSKTSLHDIPVNYECSFDPQNPKLFCRVERQTISGLVEINSALFTIRTYLYNVEKMNKSEIQNIINAINSMTNAQLNYKGLKSKKSAIIQWLISLL